MALAALLDGAGRGARAAPAGPIRIPITVDRHGFIIVAAQVNYGVPARFLLDTGTTVCLVTDRLAARLRVKPVASTAHIGGFDLNGVRADMVSLPSVSFGGHRLGDALFHGRHVGDLVYQGHRLRDILVGGLRLSDGLYGVWRRSQLDFRDPVDGILGVNVFADRAVVISADRRTLEVYPAGHLTPARRAAAGFGPDAARVPIFRDKDGDSWLCRVGFSNGGAAQTAALVFDTGDNGTDIPSGIARSLRLQPLHAGEEDTFDHRAVDYRAVVPVMTVGGLTLSDRTVSYTLGPPRRDKTESLGVDVLNGYAVLMDFPAATVYLSPAVPAPAKAGPAPR